MQTRICQKGSEVNFLDIIHKQNVHVDICDLLAAVCVTHSPVDTARLYSQLALCDHMWENKMDGISKRQEARPSCLIQGGWMC